MKYLARLLLVVLAAAAVLFGQWGSAFAQSQEGGAQNLNFDHMTTGYVLDTTHRLVNCESCHTSGVFRGTPRACATCHAGPGARAPGKPATHIPTTAACDSCHRSGAFSWSEKPTGFVTGASGHAINPLLGVTVTNCQTCHNGAFVGANALTKPATHIQTSTACSTCHNTTSWTPATNPHAGVQPGTCATCHNSIAATGKNVDHIPTSAACDTCHTNKISFVPARMDHTGLGGQCSTCHSGRFSSQNALGKPPTHVSTAQQCDTCHQSTTSWATATFNHASASPAVGGRCADCHVAGGSGLSKPVNHVPTSAMCDTCHTNFTSFSPAQMSHSGTTGQCATCHNGAFVSVNALAKSGRHIPTVVACDSCHTSGFVAWSPAKMSHTGLDGQCSSCHSGGYLAQNAQTKTPTHISTTAQCDTCHASTSTWATATFNHANASPAAAGRCSTCHNGTNALGKSINHIPTGGQCDSCHNTTTFSSVAMSHAGTAGTCISCHNGNFVFANALAKTSVHVPTGAQCDTCHTGGFSTWSPAVMNHTGLTGQCSTCHGGGYVSQNALEKPATHVSTTAQCDTCHSSTTSWLTATYVHGPSAAGVCNTCHGVTARGLSATHIPTTANCNNCHNNYVSFKPAAMSHTAPGLGACATCHGGAYVSQNALAKPATHIQTTATCDSCHGTGNGYTSWASGSFNHATASPSVLRRCASCHNGVTALSKSTLHVPTGATTSCEDCHGTSYTAFKPARMNHALTTETCATCHGGTYVAQGALAKPANHIPAMGACDTCHLNSNFISWAPSSMDHTGQTQCSTCHGGAFVAQNAQAKPSTHQATTAECSSCHTVPTGTTQASWRVGAVQNHALLTPPVVMGDHTCNACHNGTAGKGLSKPSTHIPTTGFCDTCHTNFNAFAPASMSHAGITSGCTSCHGGAHVSLNAQAKPTSHLPTSGGCETCHGASSFTAFKPASMNHTGTAGVCSTCHAGGFVALNALAKPTNHVSTTAQCDTCHSSTTVWTGARYPHAGAANLCSTCHSGTVLGANVKSGAHVATTAQCDTCHKSTTSWTGSVTYAHAASAVGNCSTCHNGVAALGKPVGTGHIPTSAQCDNCHKNYTTFKPATMSHAGTAGACYSCHNGSYTAMNAQAKHGTHIATTPSNQSCDACHGTTTWKPATNFHVGVVAGSCATCHNGTNATGKNLTHIPTTLACDTCHRTTDAHFAPAHMTHTATMAGQCSSCHGGSHTAVNALAKPLTHVTTTVQCDTCHKSTTVWTGATYPHTAVAGMCSNCHNGNVLGALGKHVGHIATTAQCDTCHKSTTVWTGASYTHAATATGTCSTCHNGLTALGKPSGTGHIPTTLQCDNCHKNYTAFRPATMSHTGTTGTCLTCHSGTYTGFNAQAKNVGHIATTDSCDTCHRSTAAWLPATFVHTASHSACTSCHGTTATGKPTVHIPTTQICSACHRMGGAWMPLLTPYNHTGVVAGTCTSCHVSTFPGMDYKPLANHVPTTASCDACHLKTSWTTLAAFNHVGAVNCETCHTGTFIGVRGKHATHVPTTLAGLPGNRCSLCHVGTTSFVTVSKMNHGTIQTGCRSCHASPAVYDVGGAELIRLGSHEGSKAADDCSKSGCHRPLGSKGTPYSKWN